MNKDLPISLSWAEDDQKIDKQKMNRFSRNI